MEPLFTFDRRFQIWAYVVSHAQLLLRSNKSNEYLTRVEILFKGVQMIDLPTQFKGLDIREVSDMEAWQRRGNRASNLPNVYKLFQVAGADFSGAVIASAIFCHEDRGEYCDPSYFRDSFPNGLNGLGL